MQFRVLGPLEVTAAGRPLSLGGRKQRTVLALLLLNANELVSRERLIDAVWGEEPPAEADASLRVYVARLRKVLAAEANGRPPTIATRANGYVLAVEPESVDLIRFRRLVADGEHAEALALWRGPALADFSDEAWARRESGVLEELRLTALDDRIDGDLAAGRHADLVPELEALIAEHPYRERFTGQLMLALYRSGRQPEALGVYAALRKALHDDFALEPTQGLRELERRILSQDPALDVDVPPDLGRGPTSARRRRRLVGAALGLAAVLVLTVGSAALLFGRDKGVRSAKPVALKGNSVVAIDAATNAILGEVPLGGRPSGIAVGLGSVWVGNVDDETLLRIDPRTRRVVETIGLGAAPTELAVGGGSVWVLSIEANAVLEVDPVINQVVATTRLRSNPIGGASQITFARGAVWVRTWSPFSSLLRIDPRTRSVAVVRTRVVSISSNGPALWGLVGIEANRVQRLYPAGDVIDLARVGAIPGLGGLAADERTLWVTSRGGVVPRWAKGTLWRIDAITGRVISSVLLNHASLGIALAPRAVWIVTIDGHVLRVDSSRARVTKTIALGLYPPSVSGPIAAGEGGVWVSALER